MSTHFDTVSSGVVGLQLPSEVPNQITIISPINANAKLPWGWHFRPTGAELITNLDKKVKRQRQERSRFEPEDISDVVESDVLREIDLSQVEPWEIKDIPETCSIRATHADELNQYFYTQKEQKYRHGKRSNRATRKGFWKATGRDKPIYGKMNHIERKRIIGYRKALVFYQGRAPNGNKTDWILHEYRLDTDPDSTDEQWVACHMFIKERNIPPREVSEVSTSSLPEVADCNWQDFTPSTIVKEEPGFTYSDHHHHQHHHHHHHHQQQPQEPNTFHLHPCVRDEMSLPRLEEDDNNYSLQRDGLVVPSDVVTSVPTGIMTSMAAATAAGVLPRGPEPLRLPAFDNDRLIADLLYSYAENPQQSIWANLDGSVISDTLWNPTF